MSDILVINKLNKKYEKNIGIVDVSLELKEGEIFGFIGPNGAGKSTTIRALLGLIKANSGSVKIFGQDALKAPHLVSDRIGYLPSEVFYYDKMRAIDLLNYSASFYKLDCSKRIEELANTLDLDLHKKIDDLSYGNKKKVGIIQALLHSPKLIILDEPTSGLDPLIQQRFYEILVEEKNKGASILFSSHVLSEVQKLCDRIAIIKEGKIVNVSNMKSLKQQTYKHIRLIFKEEGNIDVLKIANIKNIKKNNNEVSFLFNGDTNLLIKILSNFNLEDLFINEPNLEEIFMHFFE